MNGLKRLVQWLSFKRRVDMCGIGGLKKMKREEKKVETSVTYLLFLNKS